MAPVDSAAAHRPVLYESILVYPWPQETPCSGLVQDGKRRVV